MEEKIVALGRSRYLHGKAKAEQSGADRHGPAYTRLWSEAVGAVGNNLADLMFSCAVSQATHTPEWFYYFSRLKSCDLVAAVALREIIECLGKPSTYTVLSKRIGRALAREDEARAFASQESYRFRTAEFWRKHGKPEAFSKAMAKSRASGTLVWQPWPDTAILRAGAFMLELVAEVTGYIEVRTVRYKPQRSTTVVLPTAAMLAWLEDAHAFYAEARPFWLPLTEPPIPWEKASGGSYRDPGLARRAYLVSTPFELVRRDKTFYDGMEEPLRAVNHVQAVRWEINPGVYATLKELWDAGATVAGLPSRDPIPLPDAPDPLTPEARTTWMRVRKQIHKDNQASLHDRMRIARLMWLLGEYTDKELYLPAFFDFRGRLYLRSTILNPQGDDLVRGLLQFGKGKAITKTEHGPWLEVHLANCWGLNKVSLAERRAWARSNSARMRECVRAGPIHDLWWTQAEDPWQFLAAILDWDKFCEHGDGYESRLPVYMDGTNNGLQVFSFLLRDAVAGKATNCLPSESPQDIYQEVADAATLKLKAVVEAGEGNRKAEFAEYWLSLTGGRIPREASKRPVMVLPYGGTLFSAREYLQEWGEELHKKLGMDYPWGRDSFARIDVLARAVWESIGEIVVSAKTAMRFLQDCSSILAKYNKPTAWVSPCGFRVWQGYSHHDETRLRLTYKGKSVRSVANRRFTTKMHRKMNRNAISPNFVHSLDGAVMVKVVNLLAERGVDSVSCIHDSFGVPVADIPTLNATIREVYAVLFQRDLLQEFREQLVAANPDVPEWELPDVPQRGDMDVGAVRDSVYFSC